MVRRVLFLYYDGCIQCLRTNFIIAAANALGIEAASFASFWGAGNGDGEWGRDEYIASKDRAESPTAIAGTPKEMETISLQVNGSKSVSSVGLYSFIENFLSRSSSIFSGMMSDMFLAMTFNSLSFT